MKTRDCQTLTKDYFTLKTSILVDLTYAKGLKELILVQGILSGFSPLRIIRVHVSRDRDVKTRASVKRDQREQAM